MYGMATVGVKGVTKEEWEEECKNVEKKQFAAYGNNGCQRVNTRPIIACWFLFKTLMETYVLYPNHVTVKIISAVRKRTTVRNKNKISWSNLCGTLLTKKRL